MTTAISRPLLAKELWSCGLELNEIAHELARPDLLERVKQPEPKFDEKLLREISHDAPLSERFAVGLASFQPILKYLSDRMSAISEMRDEIIALLLDSRLIGYGYTLPRLPYHLPVEIPFDVWEGGVNWEKSAVSGNGLEYVTVRVVPAEWVDELLRNKAPVPIEKPKRAVGRPSVKVHVMAAFEFLQNSDVIDFSKPMTVCYPIIRGYMVEKYPNMAGGYGMLADETIRNVVSSEFRKFRTTKKR